MNIKPRQTKTLGTTTKTKNGIKHPRKQKHKYNQERNSLSNQMESIALHASFKCSFIDAFWLAALVGGNQKDYLGNSVTLSPVVVLDSLSVIFNRLSNR